MKGVSDQVARLAVLPLDWLVKTPTTLRIPAAPPTATPAVAGGTIDLTESSKGFTSDLITIDGGINPTSTSYMADAVYFGTNEGDYTQGFGGRIYRLMTRKNKTALGNDTDDYLFGNAITQEITTPDQWSLSTLVNTGQPVNATPSVGYDGYNFWLYVGTGRFFDGDDRADDTQQSFYGIKEPMELTTDDSGNTIMEFLGGEVVAPAAHGDTSAARIWPVETAVSGFKGLLKVDEIRVAQATTPALAALSCRDSNLLECIPPLMVSASKTTLADLTSYIAGPDPATGDTDYLYNSTDGWYVDYFPYGNRERNLGQATLFGGLVTFTTYQPFLDPCQAEGKAFLYTLYYQTGTAWYKTIFGEVYGLYEDNTVREKMDLGRGLSTTPSLHVSGDGDSVSAMVQTSTGVIVEQKMDTMATGGYFTGRTGWKECTE
jgi:Tfp pilus tip-associated adhesin PilY1